jgi:hypothetical protein
VIVTSGLLKAVARRLIIVEAVYIVVFRQGEPQSPQISARPALQSDQDPETSRLAGATDLPALFSGPRSQH